MKVQLNKKAFGIRIIYLASFMIVLFGGTYFGVRSFTTKPLTIPAGEPIRAQLNLTPGVYHVGDVIPVTFEIQVRSGVSFSMPDIATTNLGQLELVNKGNAITEKPSGGLRQKITYQFTSWEVGRHVLAGFNVAYTTVGGAKRVAPVLPCIITVKSVLPAGKSPQELAALPIKEVKKPVGLPPQYSFFWWFLALLVGGGLVYLGIKYLPRLWAKKEAIAEAELVAIREPAHIIAFRKLAALQRMNYLEQSAFQPFYIELTECTREYLENRFSIRALEMTTEEFLTSLTTDRNLTQDHQQLIAGFLQSSDLVKFAQCLPLLEEANKSLALIRQLIEETKAEPVPVTNPENNPETANLPNQENQP